MGLFLHFQTLQIIYLFKNNPGNIYEPSSEKSQLDMVI